MSTSRSILFVAIVAFPLGAYAEALQPAPKDAPSCDMNKIPKIFSVVDLSMPVPPLKTRDGERVVDVLKKHGINTVFRYYDQPVGDKRTETIPGKTLHFAEAQALIKAHMRIGVVYQHLNDAPTKFFPVGAGTEDAERALTLADENKQPYGTTIYFGIDGPERHIEEYAKEYRINKGGPLSDARKAILGQTNEGKRVRRFYEDYRRDGPQAFGGAPLDKITQNMMKPLIERYLNEVVDSFDKYKSRNKDQGYKLGIYCTAGICNAYGKKFTSVWLSPDGRLEPEYKRFFEDHAKQINMVQWAPTHCKSFGWTGATPGYDPDLDFNQVNDDNSDLGTWDEQRQ